ncbi:MAG TPA: hypothetical protein ENN42_05830 [Thioalkalivibrio sp.]|nr:hypothetical protein [Thioalkalivibrio sp.]
MNVRTTGLIFVYNADSGLFNTMADIGHKIFSPQTYACELCALTHGYFQERREWRDFVESLPLACEFMHRDEFLRAHPEQDGLRFPLVLRKNDGALQVCLTREDLAACSDLDALQQAIRRCLPAGDT